MAMLAVADTILLAGAGIACAMTAARGGKAHPGDASLWLVLAGVLAAAAVSRALGLEYRIADLFRAIARAERIYDQRHLYQAIATSIAVLLMAGFAVIGLRAREWPMATRIAALATLAYCLLVTARIVSLHAVDVILYQGFGRFHLNWIIELVLILAIGGSAATTWRAAAIPRPTGGSRWWR